VLAEYAGNKARSVTNDDAGVKADFKNEELLLWCASGSWLNPLTFKVYDDNMMRDTLLGQCEMSATAAMGGVLPMLCINCKVSFNGIAPESIGEQEDKCIIRALSELLGEDEDDIEDLKSHPRPAQEDGRRGGTDITFSLRKQLEKDMSWETWQDKEESAGKLWPDREKVHESVDPKPVKLLERFAYIIKEGDMLHSLHGKIQSIGAQMLLLSLSGLVVDRDYYEEPVLETTMMRRCGILWERAPRETKSRLPLLLSAPGPPANSSFIRRAASTC
jgi:hypothetical protein